MLLDGDLSLVSSVHGNAKLVIKTNNPKVVEAFCNNVYAFCYSVHKDAEVVIETENPEVIKSLNNLKKVSRGID